VKNGDELLRLLAELKDSPSGPNQSVAIWLLAIGVRELATGTIILNGALAAMMAENGLTMPPQIANEFHKVTLFRRRCGTEPTRS
jgi:hypothetical protein